MFISSLYTPLSFSSTKLTSGFFISFYNFQFLSLLFPLQYTHLFICLGLELCLTTTKTSHLVSQTNKFTPRRVTNCNSVYIKLFSMKSSFSFVCGFCTSKLNLQLNLFHLITTFYFSVFTFITLTLILSSFCSANYHYLSSHQKTTSSTKITS